MGRNGFFKQMLQKIGFRELVESNTDLPESKSNRGYSKSAIVEGFITSIWYGANRFMHTEVTPHDTALEYSWLEWIPSTRYLQNIFF